MQPPAFTLADVLPRHGIIPRGVIHVGAHDGEEISTYLCLGCVHAVLFEPQPRWVKVLEERTKNLPDYRVVGCAVGESKGTAMMFTETANEGRSSSLLRPKEHLMLFPTILFDGRLEVPVTTLTEYFKTDDIAKYNVLNIDAQGYELSVLKGAIDVIGDLDAVYAEINRGEVYEGCAYVNELDAFLAAFRFHRKETDWYGGSWGEALYVKER